MARLTVGQIALTFLQPLALALRGLVGLQGALLGGLTALGFVQPPALACRLDQRRTRA